MAQNPMTLAGKKMLDSELERLIKVEREEIKKIKIVLKVCIIFLFQTYI